MRLYICIVRAVVTLLLTAILITGTAFAMPLPSTPPEVDSTPASHVAEPEDFRRSEQSKPTPIPVATPQADTPSVVAEETETQSGTNLPSAAGGIDTGSILLIGCTIWYIVTMIGVVGGRRGIARQKNVDQQKA